MAHDEILNSLTEIFRDVFRRDDIVLNASTHANDIEGWDSIAMINILIATEQRFAVHFSAKEIDRLQSTGDLANLIGEKIG